MRSWSSHWASGWPCHLVFSHMACSLGLARSTAMAMARAATFPSGDCERQGCACVGVRLVRDMEASRRGSPKAGRRWRPLLLPSILPSPQPPVLPGQMPITATPNWANTRYSTTRRCLLSSRLRPRWDSDDACALAT
jgi:hypothetical protein